jgi:3-oxoacyl-[acyl-carrier protein] reductase
MTDNQAEVGHTSAGPAWADFESGRAELPPLPTLEPLLSLRPFDRPPLHGAADDRFARPATDLPASNGRTNGTEPVASGPYGLGRAGEPVGSPDPAATNGHAGRGPSSPDQPWATIGTPAAPPSIPAQTGPALPSQDRPRPRHGAKDHTATTHSLVVGAHHHSLPDAEAFGVVPFRFADDHVGEHPDETQRIDGALIARLAAALPPPDGRRRRHAAETAPQEPVPQLPTPTPPTASPMPTTLRHGIDGVDPNWLYPVTPGAGARPGTSAPAAPAAPPPPGAGLRALVVGATGLIGSAIARALAARGFRLALHHGVRSAQAVALASELPGAGHAGFGADLTDPESVIDLLRSVDIAFEGIDLVVLAAGTPRRTTVDATAGEWADDWGLALSVELLGAATVAHSAARMFRRRGVRGTIVIIADQGRSGTGPALDRAITQGLVGLGAGLATELGPYGIRTAVLSSQSVSGFGSTWNPAEIADVVCALAPRSASTGSADVRD